MAKDYQELSRWAEQIAGVARRLGLDFYPVRYEICPVEALYTFGAYGMPVRFTHWSFGKAFYRLKMQYDLNLSRIYELVINSNPAYAFLLDGNSLIQNKLVMAHVCAHVDFFKHNRYFGRTPKDMVDRMAAHAEQVRALELEHGRESVEKTLDALLAINEHVDSRAHVARLKGEKEPDSNKDRGKDRSKDRSKDGKRSESPYADLWFEPVLNPDQYSSEREWDDLLLFLIKFAPGMEEWQKDLAGIVREEALYFYPQMETKIINEGWATFWHARIIRELDLPDEEALDFAVMHSGIVQPTRWKLNPYYLGVKIWEDLAAKQGLDYLFEVRETDNDLSFVRNYLSRELVEQLNLFSYHKLGAHWQVSETDWEGVRDNLVSRLIHCGNPRIVAVEEQQGNYNNLVLRHCHEGLDLDIAYLEKTLTLIQYLWKLPVRLETMLDNKKIIFECQSGAVSKVYPKQ